MAYKVQSSSTPIGKLALTAACLTLSLTQSTPAHAKSEWLWATTYEKSTSAREMVIDKPWNEFHKKWQSLEKLGYRLLDFEVTSGAARYSGVFERASHRTASKIGVSYAELMKSWGEWEKSGYRVDDFETWVEDGQRRYGAVFSPGSGAYATVVRDDWDKFIDDWEKLEDQGLRITDFETWADAGKRHYMAAFRGGTYDSASLMGVSWGTLTAKLDSFYKEGYRIVDLEVAAQPGQQPKYYVLFGKQGSADKLRSGESTSSFTAIRPEFRKAGYEIADIERIWFNDEKPKPARPGIAVQFGPNDTIDPVSGLTFPKSMPKVRYPTGYNGCSADEKKRVQRGWAMAHYMTWVAHQAMDWMAKHDQYRADAWQHGYQLPTKMNEWANYAPRGWFGPYTEGRFDIVNHAIAKLWKDRLLGKTFTVNCRTNDDNKGAHPCYRKNPGTGKNPSANHIVYGTINFCNRAFEGGATQEDAYHFARRVIHELVHWLRLKNGHVAGDLHVHCHGALRCSTEKMYGPELSSHLGNYDGGDRGRASAQARRAADHVNKALRNNDNYAYFIYYIGRLAHGGSPLPGLPQLKRFPADGFEF